MSVYINGTFFANSTDVPFPPQLLCYPGMALPEGTVAFSDIYSRLDVELPAGEHEISFMLTRSNPVFQRGLMYARAFIELESKCSSSDGN